MMDAFDLKTALDLRTEQKPPVEAPPSAAAFVTDADSEAVIRGCFADLGLIDATIVTGGIAQAITWLGNGTSPDLLIVDVSDIDEPMEQLHHLSDVCDSATEVIVIGNRNDIVLYRNLKSSGVAEYFFKPIVSMQLHNLLALLTTSGAATPVRSRTGKLVIVLGVRGGVGATTIAVQTAWTLAEERERRVIMLDLDVQRGDAALQLEASPSHALREALEHPDRVDELFLKRGIVEVTPRLSLLAALEPLSEVFSPPKSSVFALLDTLMRRYRYVVVDLPPDAALRLQKLLRMPGTVLLVSDGSLISAREFARWRERLGPNTPERATLHVLNKKGADGSLSDEQLRHALGADPDVTIAYSREVAKGAVVGAKSVRTSAAMQRGMEAIARRIAGTEAARPASFWRRLAHPWG